VCAADNNSFSLTHLEGGRREGALIVIQKTSHLQSIFMRLENRKIGILIEGDFFESEIFYYQFRFAEEGADVHFLSRLWGNPGITFTGHEYRAPFYCGETLENMSDDELASFDAIIVPSGMVADRLRYTDDLGRIPPATAFLKRAFANKNIIKGVICHGLWLVAPATELVRGRRLVCHNNLHGDAIAYGAQFVDQDLVIDGDLVTARTGKHCYLLARQIIEMLETRPRSTGAFDDVPAFAELATTH
jgi:deglycase